MKKATHSRARNPVRAGGFTLIELLVVISIIAVLIGILIPTLSSSRNNARRVKCLTNLKGIGVGVALYMDTESKGLLLPKVRPLNSGTNTNDPSLLEVMAKYTDAAIPFEQSPDDWVVADPWRCPSDLGSGDEATNFKPLWQSSGTSYEYPPGGLMLAAEGFFISNAQFAVSKAYESFQPSLAVLNDADDWHHPRYVSNRRTIDSGNDDSASQKSRWDRNALLYGDWRASKIPFTEAEDIQRLFESIIRFAAR